MRYKTVLIFLVCLLIWAPAFPEEDVGPNPPMEEVQEGGMNDAQPFVEAAEVGATNVQPERPIAVTGKPGKISLDIKGMDMIDVLKLLSKQAGLNIVAGNNVKGRVTLFVKDVDPWNAFEIILAANDLAYEKKGDIITVMSGRDYELLYGEKFNERIKAKAIKLRYAKAIEASKTLNQIKTKIGLIAVDEGTNTLIIKDTPDAMLSMVEAVKELDAPTQTKVYSLNYATAEKLKEKLTNTISKLGTVDIDERTNKVVVTDSPERIKELDKLIAAFDEKTKQVLIEAKIIQIDLNDEYKLGVNWDAVFAGISGQLGSNFKAITGAIVPTTTSTASGIAFSAGNLDSKNYQVTLKALETLGRTNILSSPRIVTANNQEAKILVGTNQPYATSTTSIPSTGTQVRSYQITYLDLGVKLYVTPTINEDNFITMKIKPEVSSKTDDLTYGEFNDTVPIVKTSQAETTVVVKDGTTIVIAGLMETRDEEDVNKVPIAGDIPLIGSLFRSRTTGSTDSPEKTELVIFITPHIITGDTDVSDKTNYSTFISDLENLYNDQEFFKIRGKNKESLKKEKKEGSVPGEPSLGSVKVTELKEKNENKQTLMKPIQLEPITPAAQNLKTPEAYREFVKSKIHELVNQNLNPSIKGKVYVEFSILPDGKLKKEPKILESSNDKFKKLVLKCVKDASPFPPFQEEVSSEAQTFKILISYQ